MVHKIMAHERFPRRQDSSAESALHEIQNILNELKLSAGEANDRAHNVSAGSLTPDEQTLVNAAKRTIKIREARRKYLPEGYFEEPAYNILLDLYVANAEKRIVYVNDACIASNTPTSTALRWISILVRDGFAIRYRDDKDARRTILEITPVGTSAIADMLRESINI